MASNFESDINSISGDIKLEDVKIKVEYEDLSKLQKSSKIQDFQRKWIIFVVKNCLTDSNMSKVEF